MKTKQKCPKCGSSDIIRIPGSKRASGAGYHISTGITIFSRVLVTRFLCGNCGYLENWVEDSGDIEKVAKKYK